MNIQSTVGSNRWFGVAPQTKPNQTRWHEAISKNLLYTTPNGDIKVEIFFHNENIWLTQKRMAELFGVNVPAIKTP